MKRSVDRYWYGVPKELRNSMTHLDNLALVPASELASLTKWQARARRLPAGATLLVLPGDRPHLQSVGQRIGLSLKRRGRQAAITHI